MKAHIPKMLIVITGLIFAALPAIAQEPARLRISGLEKLAAKASEVVDVNLDGSMLSLASKFMDEDDEDEATTKQLIHDLKGIYVKSFEFEKEGQYTEADLDAIRAQLKAPGWIKTVDVRSTKDKETTEIYVYVMKTGDITQGLAILAAEPMELTVVNLVGPIDLEKLSSLGGHLGVPNLQLQRRTTAPPEAKDRVKSKNE
jgi:Domain of unknown function (DUF4252)